MILRTLYGSHNRTPSSVEETRTPKKKQWTGRNKQMLEKTQIVESLHQGVCEVVFTKADGSERILRCTRSTSIAPIANPKTLLTEDGSGPDVIPVWDMDAAQWRSFNVNTIKSFRKVGTTLNG